MFTKPINSELIGQQYDRMVRYAAAVRLGTAETGAILRRFTRNNVEHPTYSCTRVGTVVCFCSRSRTAFRVACRLGARRSYRPLDAENYRGSIIEVVERCLESVIVGSKRSARLGDLQLRIMRVLWNSGTATVGEVQKQLGHHHLAYTTVATMLHKMEERGLVDHAEEGRKFLYRPVVSRDEVSRSMTGDLVDRLFHGSLLDAISHLLDSRDVSPDELDRLEAMIRTRRADR